MLTMLLKMTGVTALYVLLTALLWKRYGSRQLNLRHKILIGLIYGGCSILSTHFSVDYSQMLLNVRDLGPLAAGLFFDPVSGILAGIIGGAERFIAGTYWNIGSYTRIACSISTCLAGFLAAALRIWLFKAKKPSVSFAFILGAVMEVFHMYVVFITHRDDMGMAMYVVQTCSLPMIIFTGLGLSVCSAVLRIMSGEWENPFHIYHKEDITVSRRFQIWLFWVTAATLLFNLGFTYMLQTRTAAQLAEETLLDAVSDIRGAYAENPDNLKNGEHYFRIGKDGSFDIIRSDNTVVAGAPLSGNDLQEIRSEEENAFHTGVLSGCEVMWRLEPLDEDLSVLVRLSTDEIYSNRSAQMYEICFADILLFAVIYTLISLLVQQIVVRNLSLINSSLTRITDGDLNEVVDVRNSSEFASLSDDINMTVETLKGYISAAEKRIEQELEFARSIQDSALPKNFVFPRHDFEVYAIMDPAKEVGGDFYDFFFVGPNQLALVIADVSGKGIPAALFMMRAKTTIRGLAESGQSPAEILQKANHSLCEGNDAEMFVTVWLGIIDLKTGLMKCANAGHEYPMIMRAGGEYELLKDRHGLALAAMDGMSYREYDLQLNPNDRLFVYTDGVPEAINTDMEQYGTGRLLAALNDVRSAPLPEVPPSLQRSLASFVGNSEQFDDITMLSFAYLGSQSAPNDAPEYEELTLPAVTPNVRPVTAWIDERLEKLDCRAKAKMQLDIAIDELFSNVARYAYPEGEGDITVRFGCRDRMVTISFLDRGTPFNPLERPDPDITKPASERKQGGLGIFLVRKTMDSVEYAWQDGYNILTIRKNIG